MQPWLRAAISLRRSHCLQELHLGLKKEGGSGRSGNCRLSSCCGGALISSVSGAVSESSIPEHCWLVAT
eukprot:5410263-Amphidinium_carterae.1